jgi:diguanylate cyclase (GGDEF)-like protein
MLATLEGKDAVRKGLRLVKSAEDKARPRLRLEARRRGDIRAAAPPADVAALARRTGLPEAALAPPVHEAVAELVAEIDRLRTELEKAKARTEHLERLADEDALMPVANRRAFMRELSRLVALAKRYESASSIVYIDLNGMKAINDRYGHGAGDAALQLVARTLIDNTRHADIVARLGGDEFGILLVKTDQHNAEEKAASLARAIEARPLIWEGNAIRLSAAVGAYCFNGSEGVAEAVAAADRAMYNAKQARKAIAG